MELFDKNNSGIENILKYLQNYQLKYLQNYQYHWLETTFTEDYLQN